jgi:hypothetical protein
VSIFSLLCIQEELEWNSGNVWNIGNFRRRTKHEPKISDS